jgi:putative transposase
VRCYAWSFMRNHVHLLVRPFGESISRPMRRLLTGYVGVYNRRHERWGHLFQNRYKSVVVEEEPYFLELIRYIHLNPVRAGMINTMEGLDKYSWSGHRLLVRGVEVSWMGVGEVLGRFGSELRGSIMRYKEFIQAGWDQGRRPELVGGGLIRTYGGWEEVKRLRRRGEGRVVCDARVLGSGGFVERMLRESEDEFSRREVYRRKGIDLRELSERIERYYDIDFSAVKGGSKDRTLSRVRAIFIWIAVLELGYTGVEVAQWLGITSAVVSRALNKIRMIHKKDEIGKIIKEIL